MRLLFWALMLMTFRTYAQSTFVSRIHHLDFGDNVSEDIYIYLSNGQIAKLPPHELAIMEELNQGIQHKTWYEISLNENREIITAKVIAAPIADPSIKFQKNRSETYIPSVIAKMDTARKYLYESMPSPKDSQCFNRAHVWSHEWRIKHNLYSNKAWLFFTRKYIRKFAFEWWFHVAPYVHVVEDGKVRERIMDVKYARGPIKFKQWTDIFIRDNAQCPVVDKYSDHANFPYWGSCFVMKSSMYYYQPVDLEWLEAFGMARSTWIPTEVVEAYAEGFDIDLKGANL
jgi:hypothetical protein